MPLFVPGNRLPMQMLRRRLVLIHYNGPAIRISSRAGGGAGDVQSRELLVRAVRIEGQAAMVA
jgi:hypothetical protein